MPDSGTEFLSIMLEGCSVDTSGATVFSTHAGLTAQGTLKFAGQKTGIEGAITLKDTATSSGLVST